MLDRLVAVDTDGDQTPDFEATYDYRTRRLTKTEGGATTYFRYDGGVSFHEIDDAGSVTVEFVRGSGMGGGIGSVLYTDRTMAGGPKEYFTYNAVGHTVAMTDGAGAVTKTTLYEAFGNESSSTGASANNRLANTKERDASIGLDNHGFRYYDPEIGRYLTRDPIGYVDGLNVYIYVHNNPIKFIDPLGLAELDATADPEELLKQIAKDKEVAALVEKTGLQVFNTREFWMRYAEALTETDFGIREHAFIFSGQKVSGLIPGRQKYCRAEVDARIIAKLRRDLNTRRLNSIRKNIAAIEASLKRQGLSQKDAARIRGNLSIQEAKLKRLEEEVFDKAMALQTGLTAYNTSVMCPYVRGARGYAHTHPPKRQLSVQGGGDQPKLRTYEQMHRRLFGENITAYGFVTRPTSEGVAEVYMFLKDAPAVSTGIFLKYPRKKAQVPTFATFGDMPQILGTGETDETEYTPEY